MLWTTSPNERARQNEYVEKFLTTAEKHGKCCALPDKSIEQGELTRIKEDFKKAAERVAKAKAAVAEEAEKAEKEEAEEAAAREAALSRT